MKGLDISFSKPSQQWWEDRRAEGFEAMVQNLWTGGFASNDGIKAVAATNLKRARLANYITSAYANSSPPDWWSLKIQMDNIRANAGAEWGNFKDIAVDVEIPRTTQARVFQLADALNAAGKDADVLYTARWFWVGHMGNSQDIAWRRFRLWSAHYDWNPDIDFGSAPYGPWRVSDLVGEQYAGTTNIEGQSIDLNNFISDWPSRSQPPLEPPVEPPREEPIVGRIADMMRDAGIQIEKDIASGVGTPGPRGAKGDKGDTGPAGPAGTGTGQQTYTVRSGDNLSAIASAHGVSTDALYAANRATIGSDPDLIQPGMVLVIP